MYPPCFIFTGGRGRERGKKTPGAERGEYGAAEKGARKQNSQSKTLETQLEYTTEKNTSFVVAYT